MSDYSPLSSFSGAKLPLRPMHVWGIRVRLQVARRIRDLALFDLAIDSKLRGCDVVALRIGDIVSAGAIRRRAIVLQQKTGRPVQFEITDQARQSIARWLERRPSYGGDWVFPSRLWPGQHLSTRQYSRLVKWWVDLIGLETSGYGTHSLRRTMSACFTRRRVIFEHVSSCWATRSLKAPSAIWEWNWTMPCSCLRRWSFDRLMAALGGKRSLVTPMVVRKWPSLHPRD